MSLHRGSVGLPRGVRTSGLATAARPVAAAVALLLLGGCSLFKSEGPAQPQEVIGDIPAQWAQDAVAEPIADSWLDEFGDEQLVSLVAEAWEQNASLLAAIARRDAGAARVAIDQAGRMPHLDFQASVGRQHQINDFLGNSTLVPTNAYISRIRFGLGLSWELDVWNRATDLANATLGDVGSAILDVEAARFSLAGQTASLWFSLIAAERRLQLAQDVQDNLVESERVASERQNNGLITTAELIRTRGDLVAAQADVIGRRLDRDRTARALEVLIGRYPSATLVAASTLPQMPEPVRADLPSNLLERRPDIQAAGLRLMASDKRLLAAKKNLLPRFSITGSAGTQAKYRDLLFDEDSFTWSLGGGLLQPLFDGGQIRAGIRAQRAQLFEAVHRYREKAYDAFREVEDGLATETALRAQLALAEQSVALSTENEQLAQKSFDNGTLESSFVLIARRGTLTARQRLLELQLALLNNRVALDLALGGSPLVRADEEPGVAPESSPSPQSQPPAEGNPDLAHDPEPVQADDAAPAPPITPDGAPVSEPASTQPTAGEAQQTAEGVVHVVSLPSQSRLRLAQEFSIPTTAAAADSDVPPP